LRPAKSSKHFPSWGNKYPLFSLSNFHCKQAQGSCYPPLSGITRRSCLEAHRSWTWSTESRIDFSMALESPPFLPFNVSILSAAATSITIGLVLSQRWFLLHEVMSPGIMVCVTLIIKTLEYAHLIPFISNKCLDLILAHLTMSGVIDRMP
jgi:hypothetical protein